MSEGRMTKGELREDKVVSAIQDTGRYVRKNAMAIGIAAAILGAGLIVVQVVRQGAARSEREAGVLLLEAESLYRSSGAGEALPRFAEAAERFGRSQSGRVAALRAGDCSLEAGDFLVAQRWYERFLGTKPAGGLLRSSGVRGLASALDSMGKHAEAAKRYLEAARMEGNPIKVDDLLNAAQAWTAAGRFAEAEGILSEIVATFVEHPRSREAKEMLEEVRARSGG